MLARSRGAGGPAALALACALLAGGPAAARGLTLEDALRREGIGQTVIAPGEDRLLLERRRAYADGARFDFDLLNDWFRTQVEGVDLHRPGPPRPLFPHDPAAGYRLGPVSPDGARALVWELTDTRLRLLVVDLAASRAEPLALTPEFDPQARTVAWLSPTELLLLARADDRLPAYVRAMRPWRDQPRRWAVQAAGGAAVVAYESGRTPRASPEPPPLRLVRLDVETGAARILAEGRFVDLEVSASGRRVALLEAGAPVTLAADRPVQGDQGLAVQRLGLRVLDLTTGGQARPCPDLDLLSTLLTWSPDADRLLVYGRRGDAGWPDGRLMVVDAADGGSTAVGAGIRPEISGRPEAIQAGWLRGAPLIFGRSAPETAPAWFRLSPRGPRRLTEAPDVRLRPDGLLHLEGGRARLTGADGRSGDLGPASRPVGALVDLRPGGLRGRLFRQLQASEETAAIRVGGPGRTVAPADGSGGGVLLPEDSRLLAWSPRAGALSLARDAGGRRRLVWSTPEAPELTLAVLNASLADLTAPDVRPVRHLGPEGQPLTSWLLAPARPAGAPPPPLVVWLYPGRTYAGPRATFADLGHDRQPSPPELLLGRGYAVLAPSLPDPADGRAPGDDLADRVLAVVEAAAADPALARTFAPARLALVGHSFGGWGVLQTLTQTDRFKAAVALAGPSSLLSKWGELQLPRRYDVDEGVGAVTIDIGWVEDVQARMNAPPWADLPRYVRNSPLLNADRIRTPVLIGHGEFDSMPPAEGERMFAALFRQGKPARLLTFFGEGHVLASPGTLRRLDVEIASWLAEHLPLDKPPAGSAPRQAHGPADGRR